MATPLRWRAPRAGLQATRPSNKPRGRGSIRNLVRFSLDDHLSSLAVRTWVVT